MIAALLAETYWVTLTAAMGLALLDKRARPLACALAVSWGATALSERIGAPYLSLVIDAYAFGAMFVLTLRDYSKWHNRACWFALGCVVCNTVTNASYGIAQAMGVLREFYPIYAFLDVWSVNVCFLLAVVMLLGGSGIVERVSRFLAGYRGPVLHYTGSHSLVAAASSSFCGRER